MRLTSRLLAGALAVIGVNIVVMTLIVNVQLSGRLRDQAVDALTRDARMVASHWADGADAYNVARQDGSSLGHRVTIIRPDGVVIGDSDFDREGMAQMDNHATRPEIVAARTSGVGVSTRTSPSRGDDELYVAVSAAAGTVRVSLPVYELTQRVQSAKQAVVIAGVIALLVALVLAAALARRIVRPVVELSEVARGIAAGDLARRAAIDAPGELGELSLSLGDLSSQLATRAAARDAHETLLVQLIESLNEGVIGVDDRRQVVRANDTARRLTSVAAPLPFSADLLPRNAVLRGALESAFSGTLTEGVETQIDTYTMSVSARPLAGGGAVLALLDLTRLRRLEAVRRDFVANVSHELRTPLTVIGGFAETLTHDDLPEADRRQFVNRIVLNTARMQRLVDDLLDLSRIESGGWVPTPTATDIVELAADAFAEVHDAAAAKGLALVTEVDADAQHVTADPTALGQVLRNLVENAVRHTPAGSVTVFATREPSGAIAVGVRDTGVGIEPEHLPRVFERFYRVDPARSRQEGGTGLGLAIVKHLVEAHGGNVRAESEPGRGTTFTVRFPNGV
ncbi:MAG: ATP-binding protein [Gemmatimonadetes bacterium]|nr:ATP-binding protein [Gemmatimonadota bacterium]